MSDSVLGGIIERRAKKLNFSETEIDVLVTELGTHQKILFGSLESGITNNRKNAVWETVAHLVNAVGPVPRTVAEKKKSGLT